MKITDKYVFFWSGIYSNWHKCNFKVDGIKYNCVEQYMMYKKALLFGDFSTAKKIMITSHPKEQKRLGRLVRNYNDNTWVNQRKEIVKKGIYAKFKQNEYLLKQILDTENLEFVEASPEDNIWGIGMDEDHPNINNKKYWKGQNLLGKILTEVRDELRNELRNDQA